MSVSTPLNKEQKAAAAARKKQEAEALKAEKARLAQEAKDKKAADEAEAANKKPKQKAEVVFLNWKPTRALIIHPAQPGVLSSYLSDPKVTLKKEEAQANMKFKAEFRMITGTHSYEKANWDRIKDNDAIAGEKGLLETEELVMWTNGMLGMPGNPADPAQKLPDNLEGIPSRQAVELVESIVLEDARIPEDLLDKWFTAEEAGKERDNVLTAIKNQKSRIEAARKALRG